MSQKTLKDFLTSLFKVEKGAVDIDFSNLSIKVGNFSKRVNIVNNIINIDPQKLTPQQKKVLFESFKNPPPKTQFILDKSEKVVKKLENSLEKNKSVIEYFKDNIPDNYLEMLKIAALVKQEFDNKGNGRILKQELSERFGIVANTVCNLYSAGYFENFLIPYFNEKKTDSNYSNSDFSSDFVSFMNDFPLAVFISTQTSLEETAKMILDRIRKNNLSGIRKFKVHGIGEKNVKKIQETILKLEKEKKIEFTNINRTKRTIIAEVVLVEINNPCHKTH